MWSEDNLPCSSHAPGPVREAFAVWAKAGAELDALVRVGDHVHNAGWLMGQLWQCDDFVPAPACNHLGIPRGSGLFLGTLYNPRGPLEFQFLAFTQALESLHRRLVGGQYVSDDDYAAVEAEPFTRGLVQAHASLTICDDLACIFPNRVDQTVRLRKTRG